MSDKLRYIVGCVALFGSLHLAIRVPLRMAGTVARLIKYGIILNFLTLVLAFRNLSGDTRFAMLVIGGVWAIMAYCLVEGRRDDYERSVGRAYQSCPSSQSLNSVLVQQQLHLRRRKRTSGA